MLLNTVIIILREVLEAALLISILLAMSRRLRVDPRWLPLSLLLGGAVAVLVGTQMRGISELLDGVGQEVFDAFLQLAIYVLLLCVAVLMIRSYYSQNTVPGGIAAAMGAAVTLAVIREGSEIYLFLSAFSADPDLRPGVLSGAFIGAGIGFSIGALFYYFLLALPRRTTLAVACVLMTLVAAGMCIQAAQLLIQADWLPAQSSLWDTGNWLPEGSVSGQLLYALVGYEASPSPVEVGVYFSAALLMVALLFWARYRAEAGGRKGERDRAASTP
ncbi:FTR1 family iron permease [Microbulbifer guangxiensis]|uniref:FTR1 family iron permease n=1 Tax=Microbulbifer guangxiensis TaxID=2904249 RepID=UPI001F00ED33|nr:FTR1 family protein [Microbulbifer guangxiensis]